jgi:hypothetical protein
MYNDKKNLVKKKRQGDLIFYFYFYFFFQSQFLT